MKREDIIRHERVRRAVTLDRAARAIEIIRTPHEGIGVWVIKVRGDGPFMMSVEAGADRYGQLRPEAYFDAPWLVPPNLIRPISALIERRVTRRSLQEGELAPM